MKSLNQWIFCRKRASKIDIPYNFFRGQNLCPPPQITLDIFVPLIKNRMKIKTLGRPTRGGVLLGACKRSKSGNCFYGFKGNFFENKSRHRLVNWIKNISLLFYCLFYRQYHTCFFKDPNSYTWKIFAWSNFDCDILFEVWEFIFEKIREVNCTVNLCSRFGYDRSRCSSGFKFSIIFKCVCQGIIVSCQLEKLSNNLNTNRKQKINVFTV